MPKRQITGRTRKSKTLSHPDWQPGWSFPLRCVCIAHSSPKPSPKLPSHISHFRCSWRQRALIPGALWDLPRSAQQDPEMTRIEGGA